MSTKDFKQGMVAGAKPFGDKLEQLANVSEKAVSDITEGIDGVSDVVNCILDDLSIQEKKNIYDLDTPSGIAELEQSEKEYLLAVLFTIADQKETINENQRFYLRALKTYLEIVDIQVGIDLGTIENIGSIPFQKTIMQTVMEFLYLEYENHDYMDDYEDYFDLFSVNRKGVRELQGAVDHMVSLLGIEGLACHYSPLSEPQLIDDTIEENEPSNGDAEEDTPDHYGLVAPVSEELIIGDGNRDIDLGTEKKYENLRVVITKQLHVNGRAVFSNCEVVFAWSGNIALRVIETDSSLEFHNCEFIVETPSKSSLISIEDGRCLLRNCLINGQPYKFGMSEDVFQDSDGDPLKYNRSFIDIDGFDKPATLSLEHCYIANCRGTFINADGDSNGNNHKVNISNCVIEGHTGNFLFARYAYTGDDTGIIINSTTFQNIEAYSNEEGLDEWDFNEKYPFENSLIALSNERYLCTNSTFVDLKANYISHGRYEFEGSVSAKTQGCTFSRVTQENRLGGTIDDCEFLDMASPLIFGECHEGNNPEVIVRGSRFRNYNGNMAVFHGKLEHCKFFDSTLYIELTGKKSRTDNYTAEAVDLYFENCISAKNEQKPHYDSVLGAPCILQAKSYLDRPEICVYFNGCKFKNCNSRGDFIRTGYSGIGSFGRSKNVVVGKVQNTSIE